MNKAVTAKDISTLLFDLGFSSDYVQNYYTRKKLPFMNNCVVCNKPDNEKPMAFRNKLWCSENHRKMSQGDTPTKRY